MKPKFLPHRLDMNNETTDNDTVSAYQDRKLGITLIAPDEENQTRMNEVNKAINVLASFDSTSILPQKKHSLFFYKVKANTDRQSFWIQDEFLSLRESDGSNRKAVDDSIGRIEHIAFSYYSYNKRNFKNSYNKIYVDLILKMARVFDKMESLGSNGDSSGKRNKIILLENKSNHPKDNHGNAIQRSFTEFEESLKDHDYDVELDASKELSFQGGNILFVGDRALVGYDTIIKTYIQDTEQFKKDFKNDKKCFDAQCKDWEEDFMRQFSRKTGIAKSKILFVGKKEYLYESLQLDLKILKGGNKETFMWLTRNDALISAQGIFHIDLFISPAGKDEINNRDRLLIGEPIHAGDEYLPAFNFTKKIIESIAEDLAAKGFAVFRNPLPLTYVDREVRSGNDKKIIRNWFFASANNCIVQYYSKGKLNFNYVWMPAYGSDFSNEYLHKVEDLEDNNSKINMETCGDWSYLKHYDEMNQKIWESLGFKVEKLTNYLPMAEKRGAARCISKVLYRRQPND